MQDWYLHSVSDADGAVSHSANNMTFGLGFFLTVCFDTNLGMNGESILDDVVVDDKYL